jgi:hypothetical protein
MVLFLAALEFELRASHLQGRRSYYLSHSISMHKILSVPSTKKYVWGGRSWNATRSPLNMYNSHEQLKIYFILKY